MSPIPGRLEFMSPPRRSTATAVTFLDANSTNRFLNQSTGPPLVSTGTSVLATRSTSASRSAPLTAAGGSVPTGSRRWSASTVATTARAIASTRSGSVLDRRGQRGLAQFGAGRDGLGRPRHLLGRDPRAGEIGRTLGQGAEPVDGLLVGASLSHGDRGGAALAGPGGQPQLEQRVIQEQRPLGRGQLLLGRRRSDAESLSGRDLDGQGVGDPVERDATLGTPGDADEVGRRHPVAAGALLHRLPCSFVALSPNPGAMDEEQRPSHRPPLSGAFAQSGIIA